ncbi:uncharacterized protein LOC141731058 [Zonotrichia albicollis]|uniref:uncharacterized protein LOC141731058 n=1 Tax=Zonotrichia albicollis TaxID=44394 RepID=UPI003D80C378
MPNSSTPGDSEDRSVYLCQQSTTPITARYLCTKARQPRRAPAPPRTYQLFHNQGRKLQPTAATDRTTGYPAVSARPTTPARGASSPAACPAALPEPGTPIPRSGEAAHPRHRAPGAPTRAGGRHTRPRPGGKRRRAGRGGGGRGTGKRGRGAVGNGRGGLSRAASSPALRGRPRERGPALRDEESRGGGYLVPVQRGKGRAWCRRQRRQRLRLPGPRPLCRGRREPPPRPRGACRQRLLCARPARPLTHGHRAPPPPRAPHTRARGSSSSSGPSHTGTGLLLLGPLTHGRGAPLRLCHLLLLLLLLRPRSGAAPATAASCLAASCLASPLRKMELWEFLERAVERRGVNSDFHSVAFSLTFPPSVSTVSFLPGLFGIFLPFDSPSSAKTLAQHTL